MEPEVGHTMLKDNHPTTGQSLPEIEGHNPESVDQTLARLRQVAATYNASPVAERVYVEKTVYAEFLRLVREEARKLSTGGQPDDAIGAVTLELQYDKIMDHLKDAEMKGARVERFGHPAGRHIPPTLVTEVNHTMTIMTDETFGPELAVMKVASEEEAIEKANDSSFGLSAYVFTGSARRGRRIARQLDCGAVAINDVIVQFGMALLPFGGFRSSGLGKVHGKEGLLSFSRQQAVVESRIQFPMELWWYDLGQKTYGLMRRFIKLWYG